MPRVISPSADHLDRMQPPLTDEHRTVLKLFDEGLDPAWEIYIQPHLNGMRPDFVLLNPSVGIAVFLLEAKQTQGVLSGFLGRSHDAAVIARVIEAKQQLLNLYCPRLGTLTSSNKDVAATVTAGVIATKLTTCQAAARWLPELGSRGIPKGAKNYYPVAGWDSVVSNQLEVIFPEYRREWSRFMSMTYAADLRTWLVEPDHASDQREPLQLDAQQRSFVTKGAAQLHWRLRGPAGCGKSMVLAARAAELALQGRDVLVVSFNITLHRYLRELAKRYPEPGTGLTNRITWQHFHGWCRQVCVDAGKEDSYSQLMNSDVPRSELLEVRLPELVDDVIRRATGRIQTYDAILIDEGQDFRPNWLRTLRRVRRVQGEIFFVADETQDLYKRGPLWDEKDIIELFRTKNWERLDTSYRMPSMLTQLAREYAERYLNLKDILLPEPVEDRGVDLPRLRWVQVPAEQAVETCVREVRDLPALAHPETVAFTDVILLTNSHEVGLRCVELLGAPGVSIEVEHIFGEDYEEQRSRKIAFFMSDSRVKACTIHSFKGWESHALVVYVGTHQAGTYRVADPKALIYVALTRLKRHPHGSFLTVVCSDPELEPFGVRWNDVARQTWMQGDLSR